MSFNRTRLGCILLVVGLVPTLAAAQTPTFHLIMPGNAVVAAEAVDGRIYAGLSKGGVVEWDPTTDSVLRHLDRSSGLGGHAVQGMAWSGSRLLVAFQEGGIAAFSDPGTPDEFIQLYRNGLASLDVTCVTGQEIGSTERIYYGTNGAGIGVIEGGREGAYLNTLDGLLDDRVTDVALSDDLLLVGMVSGWSRFADNEFTNYEYATTGMDTIFDLEVASDGGIWAATDDGVMRWDDGAEDWVPVTGSGRVIDLARERENMLALWADDTILRIAPSGEVSVAVPAVGDEQRQQIFAMAPTADELWLGGSIYLRQTQQQGSQAAAAWLALAGDTAAEIHVLPLCNLGVDGGFDGAVFDARNRAWAGDREGDGLVGWDGDTWYNVTNRIEAGADSSGVFNYGGGLLGMARTGDQIWFNQYTLGVAGFVPAAEPGGEESWVYLTRNNSPLLGDGFIALAGHPEGAAFFCTDAANWWGGADNATLGVDILFERTRPFDPASWHHVYPADLDEGNFITSVAFEGRDAVWFALQGVGVKRWDINGLVAGPDAPLTWRNTADDTWSDAIAALPGGALDLTAVNMVAVGPDGTIWAGGSGLSRFSYSPSLELVTYRGEWTQKSDTFEPGLLGQAVEGLAFDHNGDLWILTDKGLNRFRVDGDDVEVDAYTDLVTFGELDQRFYSSNAIAPLPGGSYRDLAISPDGTRLLLTSDLGAVMLDIPLRSEVGGEDVTVSYLYPNPFPGDHGASTLSLGGLTIDEDRPAVVEVLNLAGQIVYRNGNITDPENFWDGRTRLGDQVASGLYVVKIEQAGRVETRTLAVAF